MPRQENSCATRHAADEIVPTRLDRANPTQRVVIQSRQVEVTFWPVQHAHRLECERRGQLPPRRRLDLSGQPARIVVGDGTQPTYLTLLASGQQMVTWVNGVQVADFFDTREPDENPRKGLRTDAGPIALQGHDATTEVTFHSLQITEIKP